MSSQKDELVGIVTKFAESGWDVINIPSKAWLKYKDDNETSKTANLELISAIEKADKECGNCGCEYDALCELPPLIEVWASQFIWARSLTHP